MSAGLPGTKAHQRYRLADGTIVPGVTTISGILNKPALVGWANRLGLQGIDSTKFRDQAAVIGTCAHYLIECHWRGEKPDLSEYSPDQVTRAENAALSYFEWEKGHEVEPILIEQQMVSEAWRFGGTCDFYGLIDGEPTLVDLKTGSGIYPEHFYQVAAYRWLLAEAGHRVERVRILNVPRKESEEFEERARRDSSREWELFSHCLRIYQIQKELRSA